MKTLKTIIISAVLCLGLQSQSFATDEQEDMGVTQQVKPGFSQPPIHPNVQAYDKEETKGALDEERMDVNNDHAAVMDVDDGDSFSEQIQDHNDLQDSLPDKGIVPDEDHVEDENNTKTIGSSRKRKHLESPLSKDPAEEDPLAKKINQQQTALKPHRSIEELDDEIMLMIFSSLNQRDIPSAAGTSKRWNKLMDDNQLWKGYAKRAFVVMNDGDDSQDRNYKAFIKAYCTPSFTDLGVLNGGTYYSRASGVSFDGSVIVGNADDGAAQGQRRAFRWTREEGMESLGALNGGRTSTAQGVSFDGSVIVGYANDGAAQGLQRAFRWTREEGMQALGALNGGTRTWGVSSDGSVIVGIANDGAAQGQDRAFRWTREEGLESVEKLLTDRGVLSPDWILTKINAITPNGVVLVGEGRCKVQMENGSAKTLTRAWRAVIPRGNLF